MSINRDPVTGIGQTVNSEGQASTLAEIQTEARHVSSEGNAFMIASGFAANPATGDDYTNLIYIKNDYTTNHIHIGYLRTCNEQAGKWRYIDAPTALGTTAIAAKNMKRGNSTTLTATIQGFSAAGTTFTDGTTVDFPQWIQNVGHSIQSFDGALILGPGQSFGLDYAPFASTAGDVCVTMQAWIVVP